MSEGWWGFSFEGMPGVFRWRCPACDTAAEGPTLPEYDDRFCADCKPVPAPRDSESALAAEPRRPWTHLEQARMWHRRTGLALDDGDLEGARIYAQNTEIYLGLALERKETG